MNILCDEGVDSSVVEQLRQDEHSVLYVAEMEPGIDDDTVLQRANENQALLVTEDKDFGELVYRQNLVHRGVVLLRLNSVASVLKAKIVSSALAEHETKMLEAFTVISPGMVRIRHRLS